jgi:hypothetical protein
VTHEEIEKLLTDTCEKVPDGEVRLVTKAGLFVIKLKYDDRVILEQVRGQGVSIFREEIEEDTIYPTVYPEARRL